MRTNRTYQASAIALAIAFLLAAASEAQALSGTYTIDNDSSANPDYTDIGAAIDDLHNTGVSGPVVFEIYDDGSGYYSDSRYVFGNIPGASTTNTITFRPASGEQPRIIGAGALTNRTFTFDTFAGIAFQNWASDITLEGIEFDIDGDAHAITFWSSGSGQLITRIVIDRCRFHSGAGAAIGGYGFSNRIREITVRNCWFWNNEGDQHGSSSNASNGTVYFYRCENVIIEHNTIVAPNNNPALWYDNWSTRYIERFENNIVVYLGEEEVIVDDGNTDIQFVDGNLYWAPNAAAFHNDYATFEAWQGSGFDANGIVADPLLRDMQGGDLRPASTSPVKDLAPSVIVNHDIFDNTRPIGASADIGAAEIDWSDPWIGVYTKSGEKVSPGLGFELDRFGENVPLRYTFSVTNENLGTLELTGTPHVTVSNAVDATVDVLTQPGESSLASGEVTTFEIEVLATGAVGDIAMFDLEIESNDPDYPDFTAEISGEIIPPTPRIEVERHEFQPLEADGGIDQLEQVLPLMREGAVQYTIRNEGSADLELTGSPLAEFPRYWGLDATPSVIDVEDTTIGVQESTTLTLGAVPAGELFEFEWLLESNDPDTPEVHIVVRGSAEPVAAAELSDTQVDFGEAQAGEESVEQTIYLYSEGTVELDVNSVTIHSDNQAWHLVGSEPQLPTYGGPFTLDPHGEGTDTLALTFAFAPRSESEEPLSATVVIETSDPLNPLLECDFTGTATAPPPPPIDDGGCTSRRTSGQSLAWPLFGAALLLVLFATRRSRFAP